LAVARSMSFLVDEREQRVDVPEGEVALDADRRDFGARSTAIRVSLNRAIDIPALGRLAANLLLGLGDRLFVRLLHHADDARLVVTHFFGDIAPAVDLTRRTARIRSDEHVHAE